MTLLTPAADGAAHGPAMEAEMRVEVDPDRCEGFGMCEQAAPQALSAGDGQVEVRVDPVPPELRTVLETAVRACPRAALRLAD